MNMTETVLFSERLCLEAFEPADAAETFACATTTLTRFMAFDPSPTRKAFAEVSRGWIPKMAGGTDLFLVARSRSTGEFAGMLGLHRIGNPEPVVGVWIKEAWHGLGYGHEAVRALVAWAGEALGVEAVTYSAVEQNHPSRKIADRLGGAMVRTSCLKKTGGIEYKLIVYRIPTGAIP
ncbi:GNAT family N-acetyltransferase [Labrys wisconsinensis]|uniref:RimJ/RimL family protein N-acetyltransferase n=1 Tax=Labrys wisconsinensis TaxID=425677 RepID=A0ABU0IZB7_9HYPH|nr:GNAT family N-acetyltransferase [Labrys wisconsinensis]MDQ0467364.1 RimJ/RimL family protein N-acetyltransferase [Labrys wisconsinensis]